MTYRILLTETAQRLLNGLTDRRVREQLAERIAGLADDPERQGKPLRGELAGLRSLRAVGQRYRIVYRVEKRRVVVYVLAVGLRQEGGKQDIYALARKLFRQRLI